MSDSETAKLAAGSLPRPAGYASTDSAEIEAVNIFRAALDVDRVKVDLKERDMHPNIEWLGDGNASFVFQRTPMLTLVYETLERKLAAALGRKAKVQSKG
jgi:hypothetical protein